MEETNEGEEMGRTEIRQRERHASRIWHGNWCRYPRWRQYPLASQSFNSGRDAGKHHVEGEDV
jgi:hypothetical protein